ncbi:MAG: SRPBCC family protein [Pseudomonadota bacterium]|nr:SRPBCC family protein [Pseudomonadota bacterium]
MDLFAFNPDTDLELTRTVAATPATLWRCLTEADLLQSWFCPKPWEVRGATIDARPGGTMHTPMFGPDGETQDAGPGCVLIAEPERAFAFTDTMGPGFHPKEGGFMTGIYLLEPVEGGTRITARSLHSDAATRDRHAEMGFEEGWAIALDQWGALAATL